MNIHRLARFQEVVVLFILDVKIAMAIGGWQCLENFQSVFSCSNELIILFFVKYSASKELKYFIGNSKTIA